MLTVCKHNDVPKSWRRAVRPLQIVLLCLTLFLLTVRTAWAASEKDSLVTTPSSGRDSLLVTSEISMTGTGYGRCVVTIVCNAGPSQSDRNLTIVFYPSLGNTDGGDFATQRSVQLPEGATSVKAELPVLSGNYVYFDIGVFEDGSDIEDKRATMRMNRQNNIQYNYIYTNNSVPPLGFMTGSQAESEDYNQISNANRISRELLSNRNANIEISMLESWDQASIDWRTYVRCNTWFVAADTIEQIYNKRPEVGQALVTYVASGGRLFVYDSSGSDALAVTEQLFPQNSFSWQVADEPPPPWWEAVPPSLQTNVINYGSGLNGQASYAAGGYGGSGYGAVGYGAGGYGAGGYGREPIVVDTGGEDEPERPKEFRGEVNARGMAFDAAIAAETWFAGRYLSSLQLVDDAAEVLRDSDYFDAPGVPSGGLKMSRAFVVKQLAEELYVRSPYLAGSVVVSRHSPFDIPRVQLQRILGSTVYGRHAQIAESADGNWFYRNLIGAVGKPPVWSFCFLIALFGAILGPGLLFVTGRIGRRSLLILAVPLISFVATIAIITYGVLREGFDTHLRINSVQWIAPDSESGFAWSRQNYFSGLPPSAGLRFPAQSYLRAVGIESGGFSPYPRRSIDGTLSEIDQLVLSGWLRPRTQQQLLVGHAIPKATSPIRVEKATDGVKVTNATSGNLPLVVLRGFGEDDYYFAADLAAGETRLLEVSLSSAVKAEVAKLMADLKPEPPEELRSGGGSLMEFGQRNRRWNSGEGEDVINQSYSRYMSDRLELPPGGFSVLAEQSSDVALPLEGKMDEGIHLILGELKW